MGYSQTKEKFFSFVMVLFIILSSIFICNVSAVDIKTSGDFIYKLTDDEKSIQIIDYKGKSLYVSIPSEIDGYKVTSIGSASFRADETIKELEIPDTVTSIETNAFSDCKCLQKVEMFGSVKTIGKAAFVNCKALNEVIMYDGVVSIKEYAFAGCTALKKISIPNSVDYIGDYAFFNCSSLSEIELPKALKKLGGYVLEGTQWIKNQEQDCIVVGDGILVKYQGKAKTLSLPTEIRIIGDYAFANNNKIDTVLISNSVTSIGNSAFENCTSIKSIDMADTVINIGENAFYGCISIEKITLPSSLTKISKKMFKDCTSLKTVIIPRTAVSIEENAFENCTSMETVKLQSGLQKIKTYSFNNCTSLQRIVFPETLKEIESQSFQRCNSLTRVEFNGDTVLNTSAFTECKNITEAVFYKNPTRILENAFNVVPELVIYSDNNLYLENYAKENNFKSDTIKNLNVYKSKGVILPEKEENNSFFSSGYTFIIVMIIIIDFVLVGLFSMFIMKSVKKNQFTRNKPAKYSSHNSPKPIVSEILQTPISPKSAKSAKHYKPKGEKPRATMPSPPRRASSSNQKQKPKNSYK